MGVLLWICCKYFQNTFLQEYIWRAASEEYYWLAALKIRLKSTESIFLLHVLSVILWKSEDVTINLVKQSWYSFKNTFGAGCFQWHVYGARDSTFGGTRQIFANICVFFLLVTNFLDKLQQLLPICSLCFCTGVFH